MNILPDDISNIINQLIYLPRIDIVRYSPRIYFLCIKCQFVTIELPMRAPYFINYYDFDDNIKYEYCMKHDSKFIEFIDNLNDNKNCIFDESDYPNDIFGIIVKDIIMINSRHNKIILPIDFKQQLISAIHKYHDMLKAE